MKERVLQTRSVPLDSLRAVAIFLVLARHLSSYPGENRCIAVTVRFLFTGGWVGVDLFFVLSGFLIAGLLFSEQKKFGCISFRSFFIRRGLKIYPPFYVLIAATWAWNTLNGQSLPIRAVFAELLFLQDYFPGLWNHTWSLGVEEKFYLLLPLILIMLTSILRPGRSREMRFVPQITLLSALICLLLRLRAYFMPEPFTLLRNFFPFHLRFDSLMCGVALAFFFHYRTESYLRIAKRYRYPCFFLSLALFLPAFLFRLEATPFIYTVGLTIFSIASGLLLTAALGGVLPDGRILRGLGLVGRHSYSIYLWHFWVNDAAIRLSKFLPVISPEARWFSYVFIYIGGALMIGSVMARVVERPVLSLRERLSPSRAESIYSMSKGV